MINWIKKRYKNFILSEYTRYFNENDFREPHELGRISITDLKHIFKDICPQEHIQLSDWSFGLTSMQYAKRFSKDTKVQYQKYIKEKRDCDNFSIALYSYWNKLLEQFAFGFAITDTHQFNIMVDHKKRVWVIEPQTNEWWRLEEIKYMAKYFPIRKIQI